MTIDSFKDTKFNNGEGLVAQDLQDVALQTQARVYDQIIHNSIGCVKHTPTTINGREIAFGVLDGTDHPTYWAYTTNPGGGYLRVGSANNKVAIAPGTLFQKIGTIAGSTPSMLPFTFDGTTEWTLSNGHATLYRADLLQMKLEYLTDTSTIRDFEDAATGALTSTLVDKAVRIQCTLSVKTGTAATPPTIPDPDAGFCAVGVAVVSPAWAAAPNTISVGAAGQASIVAVWDLRMPVSIRNITATPNQFFLASNWATSQAGFRCAPTNASNILHSLCPSAGFSTTSRILGVSFTYDDTSATPTNISLGYLSGANVTPTFVPYFPGLTPSTTSGFSGLLQEELFHFAYWEGLYSPTGGQQVLRSAVNGIGAPFWTNGAHAPAAVRTQVGSIVAQYACLNLTNCASAAILGPVTWALAGGI